MPHPDDAFAAAQRRRFTRENAHLYVRHDADRFVRHDAKLYMQPAAYERWLREREAKAAKHASDAAIEAEYKALLQLKAEVAALKAEIKFRKLLAALKAYDPNQPRVPAGNPDGGQWTRDGIGAAADEGQWINSEPTADQEDEVLAEFFEQDLNDESRTNVELVGGRNRSRGHHYVPIEVFTKYNLPLETYKVFDSARTGFIPDAATNYYDRLHRRYTKAVDSRFEEFLARNRIDPERMTPDQARSFVREIIRSRDPEIRDLNSRIWRSILRLTPRVRGGDA
jgi:hypothetical protein